jgi:hypothetical protein
MPGCKDFALLGGDDDVGGDCPDVPKPNATKSFVPSTLLVFSFSRSTGGMLSPPSKPCLFPPLLDFIANGSTLSFFLMLLPRLSSSSSSSSFSGSGTIALSTSKRRLLFPPVSRPLSRAASRAVAPTADSGKGAPTPSLVESSSNQTMEYTQ